MMKIFKDTGNVEQSANFGWQDVDSALYGLREGYKNSADKLVEIAILDGENIKALDTFIFPILFLYRHSIEISLKSIYQRVHREIPQSHDLLVLWDGIKKGIIDHIIFSQRFVEKLELYDTTFATYFNEEIKANQIQRMLKEIQGASQYECEINSNNRQIDNKSEVWRYLVKKGDLFFTKDHWIDYIELKKGMNYIYVALENVYNYIDGYLSMIEHEK